MIKPALRVYSSLVRVPKHNALSVLKPKNSSLIRFPMIKRTKLTHDTYIFRYGFPDEEMHLGLPVGGHIIINQTINGKPVARKYTPVSRIDQKGYFDLLIKIYRPTERFPAGGMMTQHLEQKEIGDEIQVEGPMGKYSYYGQGIFRIKEKKNQPQYKEVIRKHIGLIAGGTGITPVYQILNAVYEYRDKVNISLLFANKSSADILLKQELEQRAAECGNINVQFVLDKDEPGWKGSVGYISKEMIEEFMPPPGRDTMICHCGPRPMNVMVRKILEDLGYSADMLIKF